MYFQFRYNFTLVRTPRSDVNIRSRDTACWVAELNAASSPPVEDMQIIRIEWDSIDQQSVQSDAVVTTTWLK